jgi:ATP-binding cassette subfamily F protein uup
VQHYVGGYSDYIEARRGVVKEEKVTTAKPAAKKAAPGKTELALAPAAQKMSFKLKHELENLPTRMAKLEAEIRMYEAQLTDPELYMKDPAAFDTASRRFLRYKKELEEAETRWLELEEMRVASEG